MTINDEYEAVKLRASALLDATVSVCIGLKRSGYATSVICDIHTHTAQVVASRGDASVNINVAPGGEL